VDLPITPRLRSILFLLFPGLRRGVSPVERRDPLRLVVVSPSPPTDPAQKTRRVKSTSPRRERELNIRKTTHTRGLNPGLGRIETLSMSSCLKLPITHRARHTTSSRGRVSWDIRLPSSETPDFISSNQSRRYISGRTLRRWKDVATMPAVSPHRRILLNVSRSGCSFGLSSSTMSYAHFSFRDIRT
jgi:hypothetical protein